MHFTQSAPYHSALNNQLYYFVYTETTSGNISTKYFGDKFEANKVDSNIYISLKVNVPPSVKGDKNTTLMFNIKKETMKEVSDNDKMYVGLVTIDADMRHWSVNITGPFSLTYSISLDRKLAADDINNLDNDTHELSNEELLLLTDWYSLFSDQQ